MACTHTCGLCGHHPACGQASVGSAEGDVFLCHTDDHSCYHQWTVYDRRPCTYVVIAAGTMGKGVLATPNWEEAAADIRKNVEAGVDVMVRGVAP